MSDMLLIKQQKTSVSLNLQRACAAMTEWELGWEMPQGGIKKDRERQRLRERQREGTPSPEFLHPPNIQFRDNSTQRGGGLVDEQKWKAVEIKVKPQLQHRWGGQTCRQMNLNTALLPVILLRRHRHLTAVNLINATILSLKGRDGGRWRYAYRPRYLQFGRGNLEMRLLSASVFSTPRRLFREEFLALTSGHIWHFASIEFNWIWRRNDSHKIKMTPEGILHRIAAKDTTDFDCM